MSARQIKIISTSTHKGQIINTSAETLGELKKDLDAAGIDYTGKAFFEGYSSTELNSDSDVLPLNVPFKGGTTNELKILLTTAKKDINNGAEPSRQDLYAYIKKFDLSKKVEKSLGQNFTRCTNVALLGYCTKHAKRTKNVIKVAKKTTKK